MLNLITPMLHQGMVIVGLPGNIPENALYGSYYGVGITCPVESSELISEEGLELGKALGERVALVTKSFTKEQ
jgi:NAD(P)H dehydrogenase (quinone)